MSLPVASVALDRETSEMEAENLLSNFQSPGN
jgi:hypothetical protein